MVIEQNISKWKNEYSYSEYTLDADGLEKMMELLKLMLKLTPDAKFISVMS